MHMYLFEKKGGMHSDPFYYYYIKKAHTSPLIINVSIIIIIFILCNSCIKSLINENDLNVKTTKLSNELLETIKIVENCTGCKDKRINRLNDNDKVKHYLAELEKEEQGWMRHDII